MTPNSDDTRYNNCGECVHFKRSCCADHGLCAHLKSIGAEYAVNHDDGEFCKHFTLRPRAGDCAAETRAEHNCDAMGCSSVRHYYTADVAQPEEQLACTEQVAGSTPAVGCYCVDANMIVLSTGKAIFLTIDETRELAEILKRR